MPIQRVAHKHRNFVAMAGTAQIGLSFHWPAAPRGYRIPAVQAKRGILEDRIAVMQVWVPG